MYLKYENFARVRISRGCTWAQLFESRLMLILDFKSIKVIIPLTANFFVQFEFSQRQN